MAAGQYDGGALRPVEDVLTDMDRLLDELAGSVTADDVAISRLVEASARLRIAGARMDAVRWTVLPRIEAAGLWAQTGARSFVVWLARTEDVGTMTAKREVRTARALRDHLPATLDKALAGHISQDKVRALVDVAITSPERIQALGAPVVDLATIESVSAEPPVDGAGGTGAEGADGGVDGEVPVIDDCPPDGAAVPAVVAPTWEEQLLDWSVENGPDRFRGLVRYFARHADPEADERGYVKAKEREYMDVSATTGGYHVSGFLTEEHGLALTTAMGSIMGAPADGDDRTPGQRRAQALADLARVVLDNGHTGTGASVRPQLSVTVSWTELQALACAKGTAGVPGTVRSAGVPVVKAPAVFTETGTLVPTSLLRRIACDSEVTRIVFGPDSQVLDVGRTQRTVTGQLRKAVIARDKHCVVGQCDQPPSRCEVHHAERHWADGGETSVRNAALLCYHHHALVDGQGITMRYDNGWHFTHPDGRKIYGPVHTSGT